MLSLVSRRLGGRWNKTADGSHWLRANAPSAPAGLARYSSLSHTHSCLCDHTYRVVDGLREQGRAVGETGQHELNQHEGEVDVESDVAKQVDLGILHVRGGGGGHLLGATCGGRGEQAAGGPPLGRPWGQEGSWSSLPQDTNLFSFNMVYRPLRLSPASTSTLATPALQYGAARVKDFPLSLNRLNSSQLPFLLL